MSHEQPNRSTPSSFRVSTRQQARAIDAAATDHFGIPSFALMENASRALADVTLDVLQAAGNDDAGDVLIICGAGNNGGDGYAAARHLHNAGCAASIIAMSTPRPESDAAINADICKKMEIAIESADSLGRRASSAAVIVDAIFGTGLDRDVTGDAAHVIAAINEFGRPIVAADVPSGLDCETGRALGEAVHAEATVTFAALKPGLLEESARPFVGRRIVVAGIGAPRDLVEQHTSVVDPESIASLSCTVEHFDRRRVD